MHAIPVVRTRLQPEIPPERSGPLWLGLLVHVGPFIAYAALLAVHGVSLFTAVIDFFVVALPLSAGFIVLEMRMPARTLRSWRLSQSLREVVELSLHSFLLGYAAVAMVWWLVTRVVGDHTPRLFESDTLAILVAILVLDFGYYWWHRLVLHGRLHRRWLTRWMRRKHAVHHDVPELDLFRGNVFSLWDAFGSHQLPLGIISALLGLSLPATLVAFGFTMLGFSSHHINHTLQLGPLRFVFMDNHAHKLHHCRGGGAVNHGNFFSIWDRLFGTYYEDWGRCATHMHAQGVRVPSRS